ncbi:hypothetical protein FOB58_003063 [Candida parapsilosis]|uniref:F-box domain-containing protein n=2 Tax=Candida parapsilosis TaxID=5480 RepID=G8B740_CANPC|nr:uncharacterized protein CPAR2_103100 [Candida parapsilosis]KAF6048248.1 hypothetical protein FOB59_003290 [Candida parapsilosis]KAF6049786.1 hypothetical protein FOB58_003063 [Candida parapsilosis]KAF6057648.1 hypothetical protein FOB60_002203 [Candida parapsilosis]KAF6065644.1 hypothetical protein FOB61_001714 [Candida parapsilosis]CAD1809622.1 unnamed protein product [Candida parapsilosis]
MVFMICSPCKTLDVIFQKINQHQVLALAPLHSKLQYVTKRKLYKNIYVYRVGEVCSISCEANAGQKRNFRYPRNIKT